jgi:hypothetical protein
MRAHWPGTRSRRHAGAALLLLAASASVHAQALQVGTLRIESTPSAAEVELIGGKAGTTPLTVSERDIYPNSYPDARAALYGMVTLRHAGCEPLQHRVTLDDLKQDLHLRLDCVAAKVTPAARAAATSTAVSPPTASPPDLPQRRLRQLQVLQELLDEGLISPAEEQRVRRRILQSGAGGDGTGSGG